MKHAVAVAAVMAVFLLVLPIEMRADKDSGGDSISDFKAQSLYRAVALSWVVKTPLDNQVVFLLLRSDSFIEGPYEAVATVAYDQNKTAYDYLDKSLGSESKFYYKLIIKGSGETYGPVAARPYFSPPAT